MHKGPEYRSLIMPYGISAQYISGQLLSMHSSRDINSWNSNYWNNSSLTWDSSINKWKALKSGGGTGTANSGDFKASAATWAWVSSQKISGGTILVGDFTAIGDTISGLRQPTFNSGAANKRYVDIISGNLDTRIEALEGASEITWLSLATVSSAAIDANNWFVESGVKLSNHENDATIHFTLESIRDDFAGSSNINRTLLNSISSNLDNRLDSIFGYSSNAKNLYANSGNIRFRFPGSSNVNIKTSGSLHKLWLWSSNKNWYANSSNIRFRFPASSNIYNKIWINALSGSIDARIEALEGASEITWLSLVNVSSAAIWSKGWLNASGSQLSSLLRSGNEYTSAYKSASTGVFALNNHTHSTLGLWSGAYQFYSVSSLNKTQNLQYVGFSSNLHYYYNSGIKLHSSYLSANKVLDRFDHTIYIASSVGIAKFYDSEADLTALLNDNYPGSSNVNIKTSGSLHKLWLWSSNKSWYAQSSNVRSRFKASSGTWTFVSSQSISGGTVKSKRINVVGTPSVPGYLSSNRISSNMIHGYIISCNIFRGPGGAAGPAGPAGTLSGPFGGNIGSNYTYGISGVKFVSSQKISGGSYKNLCMPASYIIGKDGNNYFSRRGRDCVIVKTSTSPADVLNYTFSLCGQVPVVSQDPIRGSGLVYLATDVLLDKTVSGAWFTKFDLGGHTIYPIGNFHAIKTFGGFNIYNGRMSYKNSVTTGIDKALIWVPGCSTSIHMYSAPPTIRDIAFQGRADTKLEYDAKEWHSGTAILAETFTDSEEVLGLCLENLYFKELTFGLCMHAGADGAVNAVYGNALYFNTCNYSLWLSGSAEVDGTYNNVEGNLFNNVTFQINSSIAKTYTKRLIYLGPNTRENYINCFIWDTSATIPTLIEMVGELGTYGRASRSNYILTNIRNTYISDSGYDNLVESKASYKSPPYTPAMKIFHGADISCNKIYCGSITATIGGTTPEGSDTNIQWNDGGSAFGGDQYFTYNDATHKVVLNGTAAIPGYLSSNRISTNSLYGYTISCHTWKGPPAGGGGVSNLSDLTININKDWGDYGIRNLDHISSQAISGGNIRSNKVVIGFNRPSSALYVMSGATFGRRTKWGRYCGLVNVILTPDDSLGYRQALVMYADKDNIDGGKLYGFNGTAVGNNSENIAIYGYAAEGTSKNWGLWIDEGNAYVRKNISSQSYSGQKVVIKGPTGSPGYLSSNRISTNSLYGYTISCHTWKGPPAGGGGGVSNLSDLTINISKDWSDYGILNLDHISSQKISGGAIITDDFTLNANTISGLRDPVYPSAAANKHYIDTISSNLLTNPLIGGGSLSGKMVGNIGGDNESYGISSLKFISSQIITLRGDSTTDQTPFSDAKLIFTESPNYGYTFINSGTASTPANRNFYIVRNNGAGTAYNAMRLMRSKNEVDVLGYLSSQSISTNRLYGYTISCHTWKGPTVGGGTGISNIVEDITPQLGGDLDGNTHGIKSLTYLSSQAISGQWKMPIYRTNKPAASASYEGRMILTSGGTGKKSWIWVCVHNDDNNYEWIQIGISS